MREAGPVCGGSMNSSRRTSRQLPQSAEMRLNSDSIQSAAALTPVPGLRSVSMLESVLRLLKLTSFSMVAWMRSGETWVRAAAMAGSEGAGAMGCWLFASGARRKTTPAARSERRTDPGVTITKPFLYEIDYEYR